MDKKSGSEAIQLASHPSNDSFGGHDAPAGAVNPSFAAAIRGAEGAKIYTVFLDVNKLAFTGYALENSWQVAFVQVSM